MGYNIMLPSFLVNALQEVPLRSPSVASACGSETCTGQGCTTCESACESAGCQTCQCVYESGQCGQGCETLNQSCSQSCSEGCGEGCGQVPSPIDPTWTVSATSNSVTIRVTSKGDFSYFKYAVLKNGVYVNISPNPTGYMRNTSYTFRSLSQNTQYGVYLNWSRNTSGEGLGESKFITTDSVSIAPVNYSNIDSIQSGRPVHIYASDITDFRNTIYDLYDLKGIARENFNDDVATGTVIQARHINNFYYRIQRLGGSFYTIGVGSSITAKVFLDLRNAINHIIRGL